MPERRGPPSRYGQKFAGRARNSNADDGAHALGRAAVDRRGLSRPDWLRGVQRSGRCGNAGPVRPLSRSRNWRHGLRRPHCKFLAKMASEFNKPRGFAFLSREEAKAWLAPQSVEWLGRGGRGGGGRRVW